jgi:bifunctional enzyme CysN/CysC
VLASPEALPTAARTMEGRLVWLAEQGFDPGARYLLRTATDTVPIDRIAISDLLDLETLARTPAATCEANDIAVVALELGRHAALDAFAASPATGCFVLVDAVSGATLAGGVVTATGAGTVGGAARDVARPAFRLTRDMLARGVCADLAGRQDTDAEFQRRAEAVAELMRTAGVAVELITT